MNRSIIYCPVVQKCSFPDLKIRNDQVFLIEPWDSNKSIREASIEKAVKNSLGPNTFLCTADREIKIIGLYCDICQKIRSSSVCIVDLSPIKINIEGEERDFIRPNVSFELGLAFGYEKPTIVITRKDMIPSDISFDRYIPFDGNWSRLTIAIESLLLGLPSDYLDFQNLQISYEFVENIIKNFEIISNSKQIKEEFDNLNTKIIEFRLNADDQIVGILDNAKLLKENALLEFYLLDSKIEKLSGIFRVDHIQQKENISQLILMNYSNNEDYWKKIYIALKKVQRIESENNKLKVCILKDFETVELKYLELIIKQLKLLKRRLA
jgi:hypothetical protein